MAKIKNESVKQSAVDAPVAGAPEVAAEMPVVVLNDSPEAVAGGVEDLSRARDAAHVPSMSVMSDPNATALRVSVMPSLDSRGPQKPTLGRVVIFKLSTKNAEEINRRRTTPHSIAERIKLSWQNQVMWPVGAQAHIGNTVVAGDEFPAMVVKVSDGVPNLQVLLDGTDTYWVESAEEGDGEGQWHWPVRG